MPLISQVGRERVCSSTERPCSPADVVSPAPAMNACLVIGQALPERGDVGRQLFDVVVEAVDRHAAIGVAQAAMISLSTWIGLRAALPYMPECRSWLAQVISSSSATMPRSMVTMDGGVGVPQVGVADERDIGGAELRLVGARGTGHRLAARFFLALEEQRHLERQGAGDGLPGPAGLDEGQQLALVVRGAAADDMGLAVGGLDQRGGRTGRCVQRFSGSTGCTS